MDTDEDRLVLYRRAGAGFSRSAVNAFARRLRDEVAPEYSFTCLLTDDRELHRFNRDFLDHDFPTDVLSFPADEKGGSREPDVDSPMSAPQMQQHLGEIAISADRAREQAAALGHPVEDEIGILMLHGLLHLLGFDHETDKGKMARVESRWRQKLSLPAALTERTTP